MKRPLTHETGYMQSIAVDRPRHLEVQVDILAGKLYLEFSNWILTHMRDIGSLIPGFYTEFQAGSI